MKVPPVLATIVLIGIACGDPAAPDTAPASIVLTSASPSVKSGQAVQLTATVKNAAGEPIEHPTLTFSTSNDAVLTINALGLASAIGPVGEVSVTATSGPVTSAPLSVSVVAGALAKIGLTTPLTLNARSRVQFATQPVARLQDAFGNAVTTAGVPVTVAIAGGGGTLDGTGTKATDANGVAAFTDLSLKGTVGPRTLVLSAAGLTSAPIEVSLAAGLPTTIAASSSASSTGYVGEEVTARPSVKIADADANPVAGVTVTFEAVQGGGSVTGSTSATSSAGVATVGGWTLGAAAAGANQMRATSAALPAGAAVSFNATAFEHATICGQTATLTIGITRDGDLKASQCVVKSGTRNAFDAFTGPQSGGTYFYDLYQIDVPAVTIVSIAVTRGTIGIEETLIAYKPPGIFSSYDSFLAPLVINNSTTGTVRYQVLFTTYTAGKTGTYSIRATKLTGASLGK